MDGTLKWILENGNQISVPTLMLMGFAALVIALHKGYIVIGSEHKKCLQRVDAYEADANKRADHNEQTVVELQAQVLELKEELFSLKSRDRRHQ